MLKRETESHHSYFSVFLCLYLLCFRSGTTVGEQEYIHKGHLSYNITYNITQKGEYKHVQPTD